MAYFDRDKLESLQAYWWLDEPRRRSRKETEEPEEDDLVDYEDSIILK